MLINVCTLYLIEESIRWWSLDLIILRYSFRFILEITLFLLIVSIDITIHAHSFTIIGPVFVWTVSRISSLLTAINMVTMIAHSFCIMLCSFMRTISYLLSCSNTFLILNILFHFLLLIHHGFSSVLRALLRLVSAWLLWLGLIRQGLYLASLIDLRNNFLQLSWWLIELFDQLLFFKLFSFFNFFWIISLVTTSIDIFQSLR